MKAPICNFCGKDKEHAKKNFLIKANDLFPAICMECVDRCNVLIEENKNTPIRVIQFYPPNEVA